MATATKNPRESVASTTCSAAGSVTGTAVDLRTALGAVITGKITNGATGPAVQCDFYVQTSHDGTNWYEEARFQGRTSNNGVESFSYPLDPATMYVRGYFTGNTAQDVTVQCYVQEFTSQA